MISAHLLMGTRPESIKLAPLHSALLDVGIASSIIASGQHPTMVADSLRAFLLEPDVALSITRTTGSQPELMGALLAAFSELWSRECPDVVVVQGDTTTALAGALAAFWARIPVVHLEAGLRSHDLDAPFPEEANRRMIGQIAALHLAPTDRARCNLLREGVDLRSIEVVGNTVVDAVLQVADRLPDLTLTPEVSGFLDRSRNPDVPVILLTMHRRESWGRPMSRTLAAVRQLLHLHQNLQVLCPVHPNPDVGQQVHSALGDQRRVTLTPPLPYPDLIAAMRRATVIISDSGGIQEEAPSFGVPVMVAREVTERVEAIESGCAVAVGTDTAVTVDTADRLLSDPQARRAMTVAGNPFGDGRSAPRSVDAIRNLLMRRAYSDELRSHSVNSSLSLVTASGTPESGIRIPSK
ncbi:non-hydrolyzing UDP-N-acetylglucosamine 2-epimerase [Gordonia sp. NPDC003376]